MKMTALLIFVAGGFLLVEHFTPRQGIAILLLLLGTIIMFTFTFQAKND